MKRISNGLPRNLYDDNGNKYTPFYLELPQKSMRTEFRANVKVKL